MIRFTLNDRYIRGTVAFEEFGDYANMSYVGDANLPLNARYEIAGNKWRVAKVTRSNFNSQVVNVNLVKEI